MKRLAVLLFVCPSLPVFAVDPVVLPMVAQMQKTANAAMCESYKGSTSSLGIAMNKQCRNREKVEFEGIQDTKPLKDCIKPGNVIDDDVRKCMKGL